MIVAIGGERYPERSAAVGGSLVGMAVIGSVVYPPAMGFLSVTIGLTAAMLGNALLALACAVALVVFSRVTGEAPERRNEVGCAVEPGPRSVRGRHERALTLLRGAIRLAGIVDGRELRGLGDRNVPPAAAVRRRDERVGLDVDDDRPIAPLPLQATSAARSSATVDVRMTRAPRLSALAARSTGSGVPSSRPLAPGSGSASRSRWAPTDADSAPIDW